MLFALAALIALVMPFVQVLLDDLTFWTTPLGEGLALAVGWQYPFPVWICFVLAGLGLARVDLMRRATQIGAVVIGGVLAVVAYGVNAVSGLEPREEWTTYTGAVWTARPHSTGLLEVVGSGGLAIALIGACVLACMWPGNRMSPIGWLTLPIRAVGAMPLSAYTAQLLVWALIAAVALGDPSDLQGFRDLDLFWTLTVAIVIGATGWALLVGRGPLEAATDRVTRVLVPARTAHRGGIGDR